MLVGLAALALWPVPLFAAEPAPGRADGIGGLAGLSREDVENLREIGEALKQLATDPREHADEQRRALLALGRVHEALNDWGMDNQLDWCLKALSTATRNKDVLASLAQAAAKGGAYHLGGVHELWTRLQGDGSEPLAPEWRKRRADCDRMARELPKRAPRLVEALRPMNLQVKPVDPQTLRTVKVVPKTMDMKSLLRP